MERRRKQEYERPTMRVVELQHRTMILTTSGTRNGYGPANTGIDPTELDSDGNWGWD